MWKGLIDWMKSEPLKNELINKSDFNNIIIAQSVDDAIEMLKPSIKSFYKDN